MEVWKDIKGYEGLYQVSNLGRVKSLPKWIGSKKYGHLQKEKMLQTAIDRNGYEQLCLTKNGKKSTARVHRLVAIAFIPNPYSLSEINHINENKIDNNAKNLEWCDRIYNISYGLHNKKIGKSNGNPIYCVELGKTFESIREAARRLGLSYSNIYRALQNKNYKANGYHWLYEKEAN